MKIISTPNHIANIDHKFFIFLSEYSLITLSIAVFTLKAHFVFFAVLGFMVEAFLKVGNSFLSDLYR